MKIIALLCITLSFSIGHCLASNTPSTVTSIQTEPSISGKDTNPVSAEPISTVPSSTVAAGEVTGSCPVSRILSGNEGEEKIFTQFRDTVLAGNEQGVNYTKLYYIHSPELTLIILTDNAIKAHAQKILYAILPIAAARLKKGEASLPQQLLDEMDSLINEIARSASPELKDMLRMAKSDIIKKTIFEELNIRIVQ